MESSLLNDWIEYLLGEIANIEEDSLMSNGWCSLGTISIISLFISKKKKKLKEILLHYVWIAESEGKEKERRGCTVSFHLFG